MTPELIMTLGQETIKTMLMLSAPLLGCALVVGLMVSVFQAVTQINEATLKFYSKNFSCHCRLNCLRPLDAGCDQ